MSQVSDPAETCKAPRLHLGGKAVGRVGQGHARRRGCRMIGRLVLPDCRRDGLLRRDGQVGQGLLRCGVRWLPLRGRPTTRTLLRVLPCPAGGRREAERLKEIGNALPAQRLDPHSISTVEKREAMTVLLVGRRFWRSIASAAETNQPHDPLKKCAPYRATLSQDHNKLYRGIHDIPYGIR